MRRSDSILECRARNWPEYNKALIFRRRRTLWADKQVVSASTFARRPGDIDDAGRRQDTGWLPPPSASE